MSFTFSGSTNVGKVRALVGDTVESSAQLSDEEINVYLSLTTNDLYLSAAMALRAMASKLGASSKRIKAGDFETDTTRSAVDMKALADTYEQKSREIPADAQAAEILTNFNYDQILTDRALRNDPD